ncbi:MAG: HD domain-containing protein [Nitrospira sp.]|nr:HD domain-containing protein [Nitrospira sp.]
MTVETDAPVTAVLSRVIAMLGKIDGLRLPPGSRRDVESILVRQVTRELERALPWHAGHGRNTATLACIIGRAMALDVEALHHLKLAAFLHDIGLLMLPPHLTEDKAPLESESYIALQHHARLGANLLEPFRFMREASVLIAHHHERWDGTGYPYGIRGTYIPLGARILAIADAFDAIQVPDSPGQETRNRVALRILQVAAGTQFDPQLVDLLGHIVRSAAPSEHNESFTYFHGSTLP